MPYLSQDRRDQLLGSQCIDELAADFRANSGPKTLGELDFLLTAVVLAYMKANDVNRFDGLAGVHGVLDLVKLETWRRVIAPYEDIKATTHGDVYDIVAKTLLLGRTHAGLSPVQLPHIPQSGEDTQRKGPQDHKPR